jgi:hypothetical protein
MREPKDIKKGEWFYLGSSYDGTRYKVKCVWNNPETKEMQVVWYLWLFWGCYHVVKYDATQLKNFYTK